MKKNIDLIVNGVKPEKVMYDTDNHSLVVLYPPQKELLSHLSNEIDFEIDSEAYFNDGEIVKNIDKIIYKLRYH